MPEKRERPYDAMDTGASINGKYILDDTLDYQVSLYKKHISKEDGIVNALKELAVRTTVEQAALRALSFFRSKNAAQREWMASRRAGEWVTFLRRELVTSNLFSHVDPEGCSYRRHCRDEFYFLYQELVDTSNWKDAGVLASNYKNTFNVVIGDIMTRVIEKLDNDQLQKAKEELGNVDARLRVMQLHIDDLNNIAKEASDLAVKAEVKMSE